MLPQNQPSLSADEISAEVTSTLIAFQGWIIDLLKHMTTLSAGSVIAVATFLEKAFTQPVWKPLVALSLVCFIANIVSTLSTVCLLLPIFLENFAAMFAAAGNVAKPPDTKEFIDNPSFRSGVLTSIVVSFASFGGGMLFLAVFFIRNFL